MAFDSDFAILTIVPEAWKATLAIFGKPTKHETRLGQSWPVWEAPVDDGGRSLVIAAQAPDRSNIPAYETALLILDAWSPRHLIVADIGGGFQGRDELDVGDLVVAGEIEYYSFTKETADGVEHRSFPIAPPALGPRKAFTHLADSGKWTASIGMDRPKWATDPLPRMLPGQIVCGERLLANPESETVRELATRYPKALAVDMESVGVARAVLTAQQKSNFTQFGVLRGISDCIDDEDTDNQKVRDAAKPYAAAVAVAAAHAYVLSQPSGESVLAEAVAEPDDVRAYMDEVRGALAAESSIQGSTFRRTLKSTPTRVANSALPDDGTAVERGALLDIAMHDKLVVVAGASGAGKSVLLDMVARQLAPGDEPLVVRIDLKAGWSPAWAQGLADSPFGDDLAASMDALLNASNPSLSVERLDLLAESHPVLILVDALNEVPPEAASKIRLTLSQYVRRRNARVLATDRRIGPDYHELRWTALELPELERSEAGRIFDLQFEDGMFERQPIARQEILRIPFFLDRTVKDAAIDFTSRAEAVEQFLVDGGLDPADLDAAGEAALNVLLRGETVLSESDLEPLRDSGVLEKLSDGGFVTDGAGGLVFSHQLIHQCLAGRRLASNQSLWNPDTLDRLTSSAASVDGVGMTIAAIEDQGARDLFLQLVYDWNWRAALVALSETQASDRPVSDAMEQAILAMVAEKRFDPVKGTSERVGEHLAKVNCATAEKVREASAEELYAYVAALDHPDTDWWEPWKQAFLRFDRDELLGESTIALIGSNMPLIGWMVANSLRRVDATDAASAMVRMAYRSQNRTGASARTARWRAVHTLGAWPSRANAELLVEALGDEHLWCRYGATRSAVEMAARTTDPELRDWILSRLAEEWASLDAEPLSQLAWAACYAGVGPDWPVAIRPLLETVRAAQEERERDRWDRRLARFDRYAAELEAGS